MKHIKYFLLGLMVTAITAAVIGMVWFIFYMVAHSKVFNQGLACSVIIFIIYWIGRTAYTEAKPKQ
jgi:uncharacterized membrane protein YGL010W